MSQDAGSRPKHISSLPPEVFIQCLSHVDPYELRLMGGVCRRWKDIITDDTCWRSALQNYMKTLPIRLLREWGRTSGKRIVQFDPRIGAIDVVFVDVDEEAPRVLVGSLDRGAVTLCNPITGKVERDTLYFNNDRAPMEVACMLIDRSRVLVGHQTGTVSLVTNFYTRLGNYTLKSFLGFHNGPVTCLAWIPNQPAVVVSGGADGQVRAWDTNSLRCAVVCATGSSSPISAVAIDVRHCLVAVSKSGMIYVWDVVLSSVVSQPIEVSAVELVPSRQVKAFEPAQGPGSIVAYDSAISIGVVAPELPVQNICIFNAMTGAVRMTLRTQTTSSAKVTALSWDRTYMGPSDRKTSLLAVGDSTGVVYVWELQDSVLTGSSESVLATPLKVVQAHSDTICHLSFDPFKLITGSATGSLKVFDLTTGAQIRSLNIRRGAELGGAVAGDSRRIKCAWGGEWRLVASAGSQIRSWDFEPNSGDPGRGPTRNRKRTARSRFSAGGARQNGANGGVPTTRSGRVIPLKTQLNMDARSEMRAAQHEINAERKEEMRRRRDYERINGTASNGLGLSEEEMISYALMMSMEEECRREGEVIRLGQENGRPGTSPAASNESLRPSVASFESSSPSARDGAKIERRWFEDDWNDLDEGHGGGGSFHSIGFGDMMRTEWSDDEEFCGGEDRGARDVSGRRRFVPKSSARQGGSSSEGPVLLRSPRLGPMATHIAPRLGPSGVVLAPLATARDEEEEMQYILELSLLEQ